MRSRINNEIEQLSEIVYGDMGKVNGTLLLQMDVSVIRDEIGPHEIFYIDSNDHDHLIKIITSIYKEFVQPENNWYWLPMIEAFEQNTGIDFYTLISFIYLFQSSKKSLTTTAEISTSVVCSSVLMKFNSEVVNNTQPIENSNQQQKMEIQVPLTNNISSNNNNNALGFTNVVTR